MDRKVSKQKAKVIPLHLTKADHQTLVGQWACLRSAFGSIFRVPCGAASRARFRRISRKIHVPLLLRTPRLPDGKLGLTKLHAVKLTAANRLYSYMRRLIKRLYAAKVILKLGNLVNLFTLGNIFLEGYGAMY